MNSKKTLKIVFFLTLSSILLNGCKVKLRGEDARKTHADPAKRIEQNLKEGRGFKLNNAFKKSGGVFDFANANELWRASLDTIDFMPLASVNYSGGIIITDWYSDDLNSEESVKIMINFLTNEIRADGLKVKIYKKICNDKQKCNTQLMTSELDNEIKLAVLKKAAQLKNQDAKKKGEDSDYRGTPTGE